FAQRRSAVRFTLKNRPRQPGLSGPKSANSRPLLAAFDRLSIPPLRIDGLDRVLQRRSARRKKKNVSSEPPSIDDSKPIRNVLMNLFRPHMVSDKEYN